MRLVSQDTPLDQASQRGASYPVSPPGDPPEPVARVARLSVAGDLGENGIEDVVVDRCAVHENQALGIRVDAVLEREIHQHRPGQCKVE